jgi:sporulation protein YlmC with PRC-barrel domain
MMAISILGIMNGENLVARRARTFIVPWRRVEKTISILGIMNGENLVARRARTFIVPWRRVEKIGLYCVSRYAKMKAALS